MAEPASSPREASTTSAGRAREVAGKPQAEKSNKVSVLGDFRLTKKLGQGGMGSVYLAHQISLDRPCALKVLSKDLAAKPGFVDRFTTEARAMAKVDHPNIVKCFHLGEANGLHFVAMELIDGQSMQDWLNQLGKISVADALHITLLCADALEHAHALNMVHRDIKPDNILVTKKGVVKVSDLGLAKMLDDDMSMTQSGTGLGTPHYMPPEQARNAKYVDQRSDIYALGSTLYHFVTGKTPFEGESIVDLITAKERGSFTSARRINSDVPERLDLMIDKCLARDPKHRYQSITEFIRDLESLNAAGESLTFISSADKVVMRRQAGNAPVMATRGGFNAPTLTPVQLPERDEAPQKQTARSPTGEAVWYVRHKDTVGRTKVSKMTTSAVRKAVRKDVFDVSVRITKSPQGPFVTLAQFPEFETEAHQLATRTRVKAREQSLADAYAKIEKQYNRQKWWRLLSRFRDGTLGVVGLIIYLAIVAAVIGGAIWGGIMLWEIIAAKYLS